jgi:uncharacterized membrane protein YdjX (TVP38/TMEM64 family)
MTHHDGNGLRPRSSVPAMRTRGKWLLFGVAAAVVAFAAAAALLPVGRWGAALVEKAHGAGAAGVALFAAAYLIAPVLLVPGSVLTLGAGFLYGPLWGTLLVSPLSVAAASIAFLLGRTIARRAVEKRMAKDARFAAIDRAVGESGFRVVLLLRLSPIIPFTLLNYALGLTRVRFGTYVLASFLGMLPGTFLYVDLGSAATSAAGLSQHAGGSAGRAAFWAGVVATLVAVAILTRIARRALGQALAGRAA